jgi:hypothetical protein
MTLRDQVPVSTERRTWWRLIGSFVVAAVFVLLSNAAGSRGDEKAIAQDDVAANVFYLIAKELPSGYGVKPPCLFSALEDLDLSLRGPKSDDKKVKKPSGTCEHCGLSAGPGTCQTCGEKSGVGGWLQGAGTAQTSLSYDYVGVDNSHVSGVINRASSVNGEIKADVSIDVTFQHDCKPNESDAHCASFHAVVTAKITYFESDDHKSVTDLSVSDVDLDLKSILCCKTRPRVPYHVIWTHGWKTPDIAQGDKTIATHATPTPGPTPENTPTPTPTPANKPSAAPPINEDPKFKSVPAPAETPTQTPPPAGQPNKTGGVDYAPATASLQGEVLVSASDGGQYQGATSELVDMVDNTGKHHAFRGLTDERGHLRFLPVIAGLTAPIVAIDVYHVLKNGKLSGGARCDVTRTPLDLPGTQPVMNARAGQPSSIARASSAIDTGASDTTALRYQTTGTNASSRVLVNGSASNVETMAASDQSVVAVAHDLRKGLNQVSIETNGRRGNAISQVVVASHFAPLAPLHASATSPITQYFDGLSGFSAVVHMVISGAATFADGSTSKWLEVRNGVVTDSIRAAGHAGGFNLQSTLFVQTPSFNLPPQR